MRCIVGMAMALAISCAANAADPVPLADFARHQQFNEVKISPDGEYLAATSIIDDKLVLSFIKLSDNSGLTVRPRDENALDTFWWVSPRQVVYSTTRESSWMESPGMSGELHTVDVDGKNNKGLFGARVRGSTIAGGTGSHIQGAEPEYATGWMLDPLRDDDENALIWVQRWNWTHVKVAGGENLHPEVRRINLRNGKQKTVAVSPLTNGWFLADHAGVVRFASGVGNDQRLKVYYRETDDAEWQMILDQAEGVGDGSRPVAFNRKGDGVYFSCAGKHGRGGLCLWDIASRSFKTLWSSSDAEATGFLSTFDDKDLYAIRSEPGRPAVTLLDKEAPEAKILAGLMGAFPGENVRITSATKDGSKAVVSVASGRNPGEFYLFDAATNKLSFLLASRPWIKPEQMAAVEPFKFKARDGLELNGYLTRPAGQEEGKNLPMVVWVHGGPYGVRDHWDFDPRVQMMASRGYAVLQVNFRGSGGYGAAFVSAGLHEWGAKMQDDVTDATRWAIEQGVADPKRICIGGASYGGYSALQGVVREPDLYRCSIGYVGVYDLALMKSRGDIPQSIFGKNYLTKVFGTDDNVLAQRSPINQLDRLKAKVMLVVGGRDVRVPPVHGETLHRALAKRGIDHEWVYEANEGHGFYAEKNRQNLYEKMLTFLEGNLGKGAPVSVAASAASP